MQISSRFQQNVKNPADQNSVANYDNNSLLTEKKSDFRLPEDQNKNSEEEEKTGYDVLDICADEKYPTGSDAQETMNYLKGFTQEKIQLDSTQIAVLELLKDYNYEKQKAEDANKLKEAFLANISHEVRTPLNAIMGFSDLLSKRNLGPQEQEFVRTIKSAGENLLAIMNDILDISKIEAGMMQFSKQKFSIPEILKTIEDNFSHLAKEKKVSLILKSDESIPHKITGDPERLLQILHNLTSNAIKFSPKGNVEINVRAADEDHGLKNHDNQDHLFLEFRIKDNGIGIEKDKLNSIFNRFEQVESHTTRKHGGTGLGLSLAKSLVELQGGKISVRSEFKQGSEFTFIIPYGKSPDTKKEPTSTSEADLQALTALKILLVEDNKLNIKLISSLFFENNLKLQVCENGQEAIKMLAQHQFDIVLMDMEMPVMDGYEATTHIRNKMKNNVPIIAMTAHAMAGEREKCLGLGMNDYISKPVSAGTLFRKMHALTINLQSDDRK